MLIYFQVLSYNGYLTFNLEVRGSSHFPDRLLERYPLVVLQGNQRIILVHSQPKVPAHTAYRVHLHEVMSKGKYVSSSM